jgi:hypothetical protein
MIFILLNPLSYVALAILSDLIFGSYMGIFLLPVISLVAFSILSEGCKNGNR